ncbi:hypothetical protein IAT38_004376 [Cryptococcus sp. DSM 104549]
MSQQPFQHAYTPPLEGVDELESSSDEGERGGRTAETQTDVHMADNQTPRAPSHSPSKTKTPSPNTPLVSPAPPHSIIRQSSSIPRSPISPDPNATSPTSASASQPIVHVDRGITNPKRPVIRPQNRFWQHRHVVHPPPQEEEPVAVAQPPPPTRSASADQPPLPKLSPLTAPDPDDIAVQTLGIPSSSFGLSHDSRGFTFTNEDLTRFRMGGFVKCDVEGPVAPEDLRRMTVNEGVWRRWEEVGGLAKGAGGLFRYSFDKHGNEYRPEMTHVQAIRLVIAASPRRMMTLAQIYQAIEERWPWHKTAGSTWKNSIRHNLSLNDCFVNAERPNHEGGSGKGGYWMVNDKLSGKTARKLKRSSARLEEPSYGSNSRDLFTTDALHQKKRHRSTAPAHVYTAYGSDQDNNDMSPLPLPPAPGDAFYPDHPGRRGKASAPPAIGGRPIARPAAARPAIPTPTNTQFPGIHDVELPARGENWQPEELIRSKASRRRPDWDRPLDGARYSGVHHPQPHPHTLSPPGSASLTPTHRVGAYPPALGGAPAVPAGVPGDPEVWTSNHPRVETRSSKHYDHPPAPYPTPNTAGGPGGVGRGGGLPPLLARSVSPYGDGPGSSLGSSGATPGNGAGTGARREPLPSISTVLHEAFDNGRENAKGKGKPRGKGKGKEKIGGVAEHEREREREMERIRMDEIMAGGEGVARAAGGVELLALAAEELGM